jgi:predicted pyridoxine 5'-phosphate oxidase superfamily flavin-nucleotide-binding protein
MLENAVQSNLVFSWQIQVAGDYAFRHLQLNPRFISIVDQIETRVERQRNIVVARESSATSALVD